MDDKSRRLRTDDDADDCERGQSVGDLTRITRPLENPSSFGKESLRKNDGMAVITVERERERASVIQEGEGADHEKGARKGRGARETGNVEVSVIDRLHNLAMPL